MFLHENNNININTFESNITQESNEIKIFIETNTLILQIDSGSVDDLEAAHDIWVNVLDEVLLNSKLFFI